MGFVQVENCGLWAVDIISIMYVAGCVVLWTCRLWVDRSGRNICHVCIRKCGLEDLWVVDRISVMYVAGGVDLWVVSDVVCS